MKINIVKYIKIIIAVFVVFYLLGSFIAVSFNPVDWEERGRIVFVVMYVLATTVACVIYYVETEEY